MYDPLEQCPFDESHRILRSRMAFHLTRCSKNHKNSNKRQCPFDVRHVVDPSDYQHHVETCPSRESVLHYANRDEEEHNDLQTQMGILPIQGAAAAEAAPPNQDEESWDDGPEVQSYNPHANIENRSIVRSLIGASKSERRRFREEERRRLQQLENEQERREKQKRLEKEKQDKIAAEAAARKGLRDNTAKEEIDTSEKETVLRRPKKQSMNRSFMDDSELADTRKEFQGNKPDSIEHEKQKGISTEPENVSPSNAQNNVVLDTKEHDESFNSVNEAPRYTSTESNGAIPKRRNYAEKVKSRRRSPPKTPLSFAEALKRNSKQPSLNQNLEQLSLDETLEENVNKFEKHEKENISLNNSIVDKVIEDFKDIDLFDKSFDETYSKVNEEYISQKQKSIDNPPTQKNPKPRKLVPKRQNRNAAFPSTN